MSRERADTASERQTAHERVCPFGRRNSPDMSESRRTSEGGVRVLLPHTVTPKSYRLHLAPDLVSFLTEGTVEIDVEVISDTSEIILHALELTIYKALLRVGGLEQVAAVTFHPETETVQLSFDGTLPAGTTGLLHISFRSELNDRLVGFYRSTYVRSDGEKRVIATTQFEPTDARRAFPCWDEPERKATFDVTLVVPDDRTTVSNMPIVETRPLPNHLKEVRFDQTPIMSSYLLAFVVGDFDYVQGYTNTNDIAVRVYTPVGLKKQGQFALDVGIKCLDYFADYFGIPFPLKKMDMLAIPDFAAGAMENWGCVCYRTTALLFDSAVGSRVNQQRVATVVAHELAHQWFGNLVTMEWWTHLWLNEGFATWVAALAIDHLSPELAIWEQFLGDTVNVALQADSVRSSHPIEVEVMNSSEVNEIFDRISYSKGASVIRMLHSFIGEEDFKAGVHNYLKSHVYANANTEDLWKALGTASGKPVKRVMDTWTKQMGFPILSVETRGAVSKTEDSLVPLTISQHRYLASGDLTDEEDILYAIPVDFAGMDAPVLLLERQMDVDVPRVAIEDGSWFIKANSGFRGLYRVKYSPDLFERLIRALPTLSAADRLEVQSSTFALANAGYVSVTQALQLSLDGYSTETDCSVLSDLFSNVHDLAMIWECAPRSVVSEATNALFESTIGRLYSRLWPKLGWDGMIIFGCDSTVINTSVMGPIVAVEGEDPLQAVLRARVLSGMFWFCKDETVMKEANRRFEDYVEKRTASTLLPPDLRGPVMNAIVRTCKDGEAWEKVKAIYEEEEAAHEKIRALQALCMTEDPMLITKTLEYSQTNAVRSQDIIWVHRVMGINRVARRPAWEFVQQHWESFSSKYGGSFLLPGVVGSAIRHFADEDSLKEAKAFFAAHPNPSVDRTVKQGLEHMRNTIRLLARDAEPVRLWLEQLP